MDNSNHFLVPQSENSRMASYLFQHPKWKEIQPESLNLKMSSLFSNFVLNSSTRSRFEGKIDFWKTLWRDCCEHGYLNPESRLSFPTKDLESKFQCGNMTPKCFDTLIKDFVESGVFQTLDQFERQQNQMWSTWISTPLMWGWNQLSGTESSPVRPFCEV